MSSALIISILALFASAGSLGLAFHANELAGTANDLRERRALTQWRTEFLIELMKRLITAQSFIKAHAFNAHLGKIFGEIDGHCEVFNTVFPAEVIQHSLKEVASSFYVPDDDRWAAPRESFRTIPVEEEIDRLVLVVRSLLKT